MRAVASLVVVVAVVAATAAASIYDCWDDDKLKRMTFRHTQEEEKDPGLNMFSKMVKCLTDQSRGGTSGQLESDWNQWSNFARTGQFGPEYNSRNDLSRGYPGPGMQGMPGVQGMPGQAMPGMPGQGMPGMPRGPQDEWRSRGTQPKPGVHPDDWGRVPMGPGGRDGLGPGGMMPPPGPGGPRDPVDPRQRDRDRERDRDRDQDDKGRRDGDKKKPRVDSPDIMPPEVPMDPYGVRPGYGPGVMTPGIGPGSIYPHEHVYNEQESQSVLLTRKFGYIITALAVAVFAVFVVGTILCCQRRSSSPPAVPLPQIIAPGDTYSIYSYSKGAPVDTLRSMDLRTETMKSTRSMASRASPQYRVSDIDPDYARQYRQY